MKQYRVEVNKHEAERQELAKAEKFINKTSGCKIVNYLLSLS